MNNSVQIHCKLLTVQLYHNPVLHYNHSEVFLYLQSLLFTLQQFVFYKWLRLLKLITVSESQIDIVEAHVIWHEIHAVTTEYIIFTKIYF